MKKKWELKHQINDSQEQMSVDEIISQLLENRGISSEVEKHNFLHPQHPSTLTAADVGINSDDLELAINRIEQALNKHESIIVYADYDADGITAGAVMWETLYALGANVKPYIPHRQEEGYGLSVIGIDSVKNDYQADLIITVDHGITGWEKVEYALEEGIDVVITDHHTKPERLPRAPIVHTTQISGAGVSWFVSKTLYERNKDRLKRQFAPDDLVGLTAIGIIADLLPLIGPNRAIVRYGLENLSNTKRLGILAMVEEAGLEKKQLTTYDISHILAPRINALGRLEHALDALRLLCTTSHIRAKSLAEHLGAVNKERQQLTQESTSHAQDIVSTDPLLDTQKIIVIAHEMYNPGIIGLVAGKLVEEHMLPAIVIAQGETISKASARSIPGFNIVEAIRSQQQLLVDVGGHPMAAGFSIETKHIPAFIQGIKTYAQSRITPEMRVKQLTVDLIIPFSVIDSALYREIQQLSPFGTGNYEPVFAAYDVLVEDIRLVGAHGTHLKCTFRQGQFVFDAIAFNLGELFPLLTHNTRVNIAFTIDNNVWNGREKLQLKVKDIQILEKMD